MGTLYSRHPRKEGCVLRGRGCVQQVLDSHDKPVDGGSCGMEEDRIAEEKSEEDGYSGSRDEEVIKVVVCENVFIDVVVELVVVRIQE